MMVLEVLMETAMMMLKFKMAATAVIVVLVTFAVMTPVSSESSRERSA